MDNNTIIIGLDLSLTHFGMVALSGLEGQVLCCAYLYPTQKYVLDLTKNTPKIESQLLCKKLENEGREVYTARRIEQSSKMITDLLHYWTTSPESRAYVLAIEDYAVGVRDTTGLVQIAELTGVVKHWIYNNDGMIRAYDPSTVKLFATGKGNALKCHVVEAADHAGFSLPKELFQTVKKKVRGVSYDELDGPGSDLCDAFFLAKMLWTEMQIRCGRMELKDVPDHIREKIFFRTSKANPVNILARDFIRKVEG